MKFLRFSFVILMLVVTIACRRSVPRPEGMPPLTPCTIVVTFGGEAIENVGVLLRAKDQAHRWGAGGRTDKTGKTSLKTGGAFDGVVPGDYVISFSKRVTRSDGPMGGEYSLIPMKYAPGQSKEMIHVTEDKNVYTFELDGGPEE